MHRQRDLNVVLTLYSQVVSEKVVAFSSALGGSTFNTQKKSFAVKKTRLLAFNVTVFVNFEEELSKYGSDKNCRSKLYFSTVMNLMKIC